MTDRELDDEALRVAFQNRRLDPDDDWPDGDQVLEAVEGTASPEERRDLVERMATSPATAEAWRMAVELRGGEISSSDNVRPLHRRASLLVGVFGLAAAAVAVIAVGLDDRVTPVPEFRRPETASIRSSQTNGQSLMRDDLVLEWTADVEDATYDIVVLTESLDEVDSATGLSTNRHRVPKEAIANIPPGGRVLWRVVARTPEGTSISSATFVVTVAEPTSG